MNKNICYPLIGLLTDQRVIILDSNLRLMSQRIVSINDEESVLFSETVTSITWIGSSLVYSTASGQIQYLLPVKQIISSSPNFKEKDFKETNKFLYDNLKLDLHVITKQCIFEISKVENYNENINESSNIIYEKYIQIICQYLFFITENTKITNYSYFHFILIKGFETISHVFINLLYYTKNIDITYYNSQKAFYYFLEFIEQTNNLENCYLKLNTKDAILYVYNKTLFEINLNKKREINILNDEKIIFDNLILLKQIHTSFLIILINDTKDKNNFNIKIFEAINLFVCLFKDMNYKNIVLVNQFFEKNNHLSWYPLLHHCSLKMSNQHHLPLAFQV
jgi:hypothetical protein